MILPMSCRKGTRHLDMFSMKLIIAHKHSNCDQGACFVNPAFHEERSTNDDRIRRRMNIAPRNSYVEEIVFFLKSSIHPYSFSSFLGDQIVINH